MITNDLFMENILISRRELSSQSPDELTPMSVSANEPFQMLISAVGLRSAAEPAIIIGSINRLVCVR